MALLKFRRNQETPLEASVTAEGRQALHRYAGMTGALAESRNWWRWAFLATLPVIATLGAANAWLAIDRPPVEVLGVPYEPSGRIHDVVRGGEWSPDGRVVAYRLGEWIREVRRATPDKLLQAQGTTAAGEMTTDRGKAMLAELYGRDPDGKPWEFPPEKARMVDDVEVTERTDNAFAVSWRETTYNNNTIAGRARYSGTIVVQRVGKAENAEAVLRNPLGVFVDTVSWQQIGDK